MLGATQPPLLLGVHQTMFVTSRRNLDVTAGLTQVPAEFRRPNSQRYDRSLQQQIGVAAFLFRTLFFVVASPFGFLQRHPCVEEGSKVVRPRQRQHLQAVFVFFSFVPLCLKGQAFGCFSARKAKHKFKLDLKLSS